MRRAQAVRRPPWWFAARAWLRTGVLRDAVRLVVSGVVLFAVMVEIYLLCWFVTP